MEDASMLGRNALRTIFLLLISGSSLTQVAHKAPSADTTAIYHDVLSQYFSGERESKINLARYTSAFEMPSEPDACGKGFVHAPEGAILDLSLAPSFGDNITLVDPETHKQADPGDAIRRGVPVDEAVTRGFANALFSLSEVLFSRDGTHAVVSYSFRCGRLCGSGETVLYNRIGKIWKRGKRRCGGWVS